jgi:hypothetical protein
MIYHRIGGLIDLGLKHNEVIQQMHEFHGKIYVFTDKRSFVISPRRTRWQRVVDWVKGK